MGINNYTTMDEENISKNENVQAK
jgi:hypothetical protein